MESEFLRLKLLSATGRLCFALLFSLLFLPAVASAATNVYYSVGQNTSNHETGSPTVTIDGSGNATFSVPQTAANMGVGDVVTYGGGSVAFITGKTSTSVWTVETATGALPATISSSPVTSITHAFASLNAAIGYGVSGNATSTNFLNTSDLTSGNYVLNIPCYYDSGSDGTAVSIKGITTSATDFIRIYTATSTTSQVNRNQRNNGTWTSTAYNMTTTGSGTLNIQFTVSYIYIDGLQLSNDTGGNIGDGALDVSPSSVYISDNIIRTLTPGLPGNRGIYFQASNASAENYYVWNNLIYYDGAGVSTSNGIASNANHQNIYVYSNTIVNFSTGINIIPTGAAVIAKNNLLYNDNAPASGTFAAGTDYNTTATSSMWYTVTGAGNTHDRVSQTFTFVNAGGRDYHLTSSDAGARDVGVSLSGDGNLPFNYDIDAQSRPYNSIWDMGADEYQPALVPTVITAAASSITSTGAVLNGTITLANGASITQSGFAYGTNSTLATVIATTTLGSQTAPTIFSGSVSSLTCGTTYYARAYATNSVGAGMGSIVSFTTGSCEPVISPTSVATTTTTATITWTTDESATSTVNYGLTSGYGSASTSAVFVLSHSIVLTGLSAGTTYDYAVSSQDGSGNVTSSNNLTFTTAALPPTLLAPTTSSITTTTATASSTITFVGGANASAEGFVYGLTLPYSATTTSSGSFGVGGYTASLSSLTCGSTYHLAAYATNSGGTGYSSDSTFTTGACPIYYIRAGAAGTNDGSSWTNAYPTFASVSSWVRGGVYYVAGGTYNENITILTAPSGSLWITIKKANDADNSSNPGWNESYATNVATINGSVDFGNGYVSLNGVTGSGQSGHGIHILNPSYTDVVTLEGGYGPYSIQHVNIEGAGFAASASAYAGIKEANFGSTEKNLYIGYNWIHQTTTNGVTLLGLVGTSYSDYGFTFENNVISETGGCLNVNNHGQAMQLGNQLPENYVIIRNNIFRNVIGSAYISMLTGTTNLAIQNMEIYNNLFYQLDTTTYNAISPGVIFWEGSHNGIETGNSLVNVLIANNTFWDIGPNGSSNRAQIAIGTGVSETITNVVSENNLWESSYFSSPDSGLTSTTSNGYFGNTGAGFATTTANGQVNGLSSTLSSPGSENFSLVVGGYAVGAGVNLSSLFTTDASGATRPATGAWDLGAFIYSTGAPTLTTSAASSLAQTSATLNGSITSTGGSNSTQSGFAYSTDATLTAGVSTTTLGAKTGTVSFSSNISSLTCNTTYYDRAYATNLSGTGYGSVGSFNTSACSVASTPVTSTPSPVVHIYGQSQQRNVSLPQSEAQTQTTVSAAAPITNALFSGSIGSSVITLQIFLNNHGFDVAPTGNGSPGHETNYFGFLTKSAVEKFQLHYGIVKTSSDPGYGIVGPKTRAEIAALSQ